MKPYQITIKPKFRWKFEEGVYCGRLKDLYGIIMTIEKADNLFILNTGLKTLNFKFLKTAKAVAELIYGG